MEIELNIEIQPTFLGGGVDSLSVLLYTNV